MDYPGLVDDSPLTLDAEAVAAAADAVRNRCGWHIAPSVTEALTVDGSGTSELILRSTAHITAISSVVELGRVMAVDEYDWSEVGILTKRSGGYWTDRRRGIVINLTHGYPTCPREVRAVVARLAKAGLTPDRVTSIARGPFSVGMDTSDVGRLDEYSDQILDRYAVA